MSSGNDHQTPPTKRWYRDPFTFVTGSVGLVSGYFGIVQAGGAGEIALRAIAAIAVLLLLIRLTQALLIDQVRRLRRNFSTLQEEFAQYKAGAAAERTVYRSAIERLVDRQSLLYEEELEVVVIIGATSSDDRIIENHVTTPTPYLFYRSLRPITPRNTIEPMDFEDLHLEAKVAQEDGDRGVGLTVLPLVESAQGVRALILFEPAVSVKLSWTLTYNPRGLWDPLRVSHVDYLAWDARSPAGTPGTTTFKKFTVRFVFPTGTTNFAVQERHNLGQTQKDMEFALGPSSVWTDDSPQGTRYEWDISMPALASTAG